MLWIKIKKIRPVVPVLVLAVTSIMSLVLSSGAYGVELDPYWVMIDSQYEKRVVISCDGEDSFVCLDVCDNRSECEVAEFLCKNCVGSDIYITNLFREMGRTYTNSGERADLGEVSEVLARGSFQTLTSNSILNLVETYDSPRLRRQFESLCWSDPPSDDPVPEEPVQPVVVLEKDERTNKLLKARFIFCGGVAYTVDRDPATVIQ